MWRCCLCNVPKHKRAVMCLMKKINVLDKLHYGMNCSAVGNKDNVDELILFQIKCL